MILTLKTLDQKVFRMEVEDSETVSEFLSGIEDLMGEDNIYKVIYQGKLLKERTTLADYNINPKKCLILIISKPPNNAIVKSVTKSANFTLARPTTLKLPTATDKTYRTQDDGTDSGYSSPTELMEARLHPEEETSNTLGDDDSDKHYVTESEFSIALDVIIASDYLKQDCDNRIMNKKDIFKAVSGYPYDEKPKEDLKSFILGKRNQIEEASVNSSQLHAFLNDIEDIYNEKRTETKKIKKTFDYNEMMFDMEDLEEGPHQQDKDVREREQTPIEVKDFPNFVPHIKKGVTRHQIELAMRDSFASPGEVSQYLDDIGFQHEQIEIAMKTSFGSPDEAVDYLMNGTPPSRQENPLDFLRKNQEFRNIRIIVKRNPELLSSMILSFGSKNPHLHDLIYENKLSFVRLINEPETEYNIPENQKYCR